MFFSRLFRWGPVYSKPRHKCPFYGFFLLGLLMTDDRGFGCGLDNSICYMKNETPDWNKCPFKIEDGKTETIKDSYSVYSKDFNFPKKQQISLRRWWNFVMNDKTRRPN